MSRNSNKLCKLYEIQPKLVKIVNALLVNTLYILFENPKFIVIPAQAGISLQTCTGDSEIPACAGMTESVGWWLFKQSLRD
jgi:hypothetical protein